MSLGLIKTKSLKNGEVVEEFEGTLEELNAKLEGKGKKPQRARKKNKKSQKADT